MCSLYTLTWKLELQLSTMTFSNQQKPEKSMSCYVSLALIESTGEDRDLQKATILTMTVMTKYVTRTTEMITNDGNYDCSNFNDDEIEKRKFSIVTLGMRMTGKGSIRARTTYIIITLTMKTSKTKTTTSKKIKSPRTTKWWQEWRLFR